MDQQHKSVMSESTNLNISEDSSHGWHKVSYTKKHKKPQKSPHLVNGSVDHHTQIGNVGVFTKLEKQSEERRRRIEAQRAAKALYDDDGVVVKRGEEEEGESDEEEGVGEGGKRGGVVEVKKEKVKKVKKAKVTIVEAAAKIDAHDLGGFLNEITASYESKPDIQLLRFADYFGRAFSAVSASQFPWQKLFRESPLAKIADVPVSHISETVYNTSVDWINQHSHDTLGSFVLWGLDSILSDLAAQHTGSKVSKKVSQPSSKSQVAMFIVISMVLRRKPDVIISVLPELRENSKYQGHDKLPVILWMIVQASHGDLAVGLYAWAHYSLPLLGGKLGSNPQSRDLILQLVERILSAPKARAILVNGAVRKGVRLMPPTALDQLLHATFPPSSSRVKATARFEAIYPTLKEVALAGSPGSKAMKQVSQQIMSIALRSANEGVPELSSEAASISIWCLSQSPDSYKQWDKLYMDNLEASVKILKKLSDGWKELSTKQSSAEAFTETLKSFRQKNEKALEGGDVARQAVFKEADKYSKVLLGKLSRGNGCLKSLAFVVIVVAAGAAFVSPNVESFDWDKVSLYLSQSSFLKM